MSEILTPAPEREKFQFWMSQALNHTQHKCHYCEEDAVDYGYYGDEQRFVCNYHRGLTLGNGADYYD